MIYLMFYVILALLGIYKVHMVCSFVRNISNSYLHVSLLKDFNQGMSAVYSVAPCVYLFFCINSMYSDSLI